MTIRYQCEDCESVLKIRDELAGTEGKCPKCKAVFTVPDAEPDESPGIEIEHEPDEDDDLIDIPMDVTPDVDPNAADASGFDPMDILSGTALGGDGGSSATEASERKPSVAELMRDHEQSKKKPAKTSNTRGKIGNQEAAAQAAKEVVTAGSADDVIASTYKRKRGSASDPKPLSRTEQRAADQKEAFKRFAIKYGIVASIVCVGGYFFLGWVLSDEMPDLADVSGVVSVSGAPMSGVRVVFSPVEGPNGEKVEASGSTGITNAQGEYDLMYNADYEGAVPAVHQVELTTREGVVFMVPDGERQKTVTMDGDNVFDFNL